RCRAWRLGLYPDDTKGADLLGSHIRISIASLLLKSSIPSRHSPAPLVSAQLRPESPARTRPAVKARHDGSFHPGQEIQQSLICKVEPNQAEPRITVVEDHIHGGRQEKGNPGLQVLAELLPQGRLCRSRQHIQTQIGRADGIRLLHHELPAELIPPCRSEECKRDQ